MLTVLSITFPIFAAIALGYACTARGLFSQSEMPVLGRFVVNISLPALIFFALVSRPLAEVIDPGYLLAYAAVALGTMSLGWVVLTLGGWDGSRRAVAILGMGCPNTGYMGYPIILLAWPHLAEGFLAQNVIIENFLTLPLAILLMELSQSRARQQPLRVIGAIALGMLRRPMIQMLLLGLAVNLLGIPMPDAISRFAKLLAGATAAIALFYIGGSLVGLPLRGNFQVAGVIVAMKLLAMPALALAALTLLPLIGLPAVAPELHAPLILGAAMPTLGIYAILAADYKHEGMASIALLGATVLSFFTVSGILALLHH